MAESTDRLATQTDSNPGSASTLGARGRLVLCRRDHKNRQRGSRFIGNHVRKFGRSVTCFVRDGRKDLALRTDAVVTRRGRQEPYTSGTLSTF